MPSSEESHCDVAVVIPTRNRSGFVREAVESVLQQTLVPKEIVVVDDQSSDDTLNVLAQFGSRIRVISCETNIERAATRNLGVANTTAKFIAFLDDDDLWHPRKLEVQVAATKADNSELSFVGTRQVDSDGNVLHDAHYPKLSAWNNVEQINAGFGLSSTILISRELFKRAAGFPESKELVSSEDWIFLATLKSLGVEPLLIRHALVDLTVHPQSTSVQRVAPARSLAPAVAYMKSKGIISGSRADAAELFAQLRSARLFIKAGEPAAGLSECLKVLTNGKALRPSVLAELIRLLGRTNR